ncbi:lytic murein transglycosylase B [Stutzerimonas kirkiae]|uniref:Lytic murein transglycosylase B n=2 Tax=Stutzerimonas kirkiae TaxID=2211392 RepID=A0A4Q9R1K7_9GAMM|nr:lytic murein transglycosylase B [Stutzerimonas kirkiae]TBU99455.1 lytic murein transglycosylase B [Stutzerimonas kirkiae]TBV05554.1 lytic murein transglycosylase B [Stutzerimonas kirkiae]TBV10706.1 lytic murein transglycosylase B [Stutzerimonas kirkiae]
MGAQSAWASDYKGEKVAGFIAEMASEYGFASEQLAELLAQAERKQAILDAISRPAERVRPWKEYRPIFITDARIAQGVDFWRQNQDALQQAEAKYGVPAEVIVAIIGVETFYGRNTGNYRVIDALATLGFDYPPRQPFFRKELKEFLLLAREEQVDPLTLKGSYAGAMGLPQFMPSSFRAYAVDFDADGHIDIWSNPTDAIGSAANYFKRHGWLSGGEVAVRATVAGERFEEGLTQGLEPGLNAAQLRELGWQPATAIADEAMVTAFRLEGAEGDEYWIGLPNFYVITRYNRSVMYAMAVNQLADALAKARGQQ